MNTDSLRLCISGGEALSATVAAEFERRFGRKILPGYGATETAPVISMNRELAWKPGTVGQPLGADNRLDARVHQEGSEPGRRDGGGQGQRGVTGPEHGKKPGDEIRVIREEQPDARFGMVSQDGSLAPDLLEKLAVGNGAVAVVHRDSFGVFLRASAEERYHFPADCGSLRGSRFIAQGEPPGRDETRTSKAVDEMKA